MPDGISFALPTLSSADMSRDEQGALVVNQATAVIVATYLQFAATLSAQYMIPVGNTNPSWNQAKSYLITPSELPGLIDSVQNALRSF